MEKIPIDTNLLPRKPHRQNEAYSLIKAQPRTKDELAELMGVKKGNLAAVLQKLISSAKIIPNSETGKYEIYPEKL
jgi:hypothetical protein